MSRFWIHSLLILFGLFLTFPGAQAEDTTWEPLFEGESLEGMEITNDGNWRFFQNILNGQAIGEGTTTLVGPEVTGNFKLRLRFKVVGNRKGAVLLRSHYLEEKIYGYKVELPPYIVQPGENSADWAPGSLHLVGDHPEILVEASPVPVDNPSEVFRNWSELVITSTEEGIVVEINGTEVASIDDDRYIGGHIGFESASSGGIGLVMFQDVEIAELPTEEDYQSLFNGEDLEGWKVHGLDKQWWVEDGVIHSESVDDAYSYLATNDEYEDFSIVAEFLGLAGGNSGLFFHSHLDGTKISGIQAEVQPPNEKRLGHSGNLYDSAGRRWLIDPETLAPEKEAVFRMGEWNTIRVDVKDHHIKTWINGLQIVDFMDNEPAHPSGVIALQIHSGGGVKVDWRNLRIKKL